MAGRQARARKGSACAVEATCMPLPLFNALRAPHRPHEARRGCVLPSLHQASASCSALSPDCQSFLYMMQGTWCHFRHRGPCADLQMPHARTAEHTACQLLGTTCLTGSSVSGSTAAPSPTYVKATVTGPANHSGNQPQEPKLQNNMKIHCL